MMLLAYLGCNGGDGESDCPLQRFPVQEDASIASEFSLDLLRALAANRGNVAVAPLVTLRALALLRSGSSGDTASQISRASGLPTSGSTLGEWFRATQHGVGVGGGGACYRENLYLVAESDQVLDTEYAHLAAVEFGAHVATLDDLELHPLLSWATHYDGLDVERVRDRLAHTEEAVIIDGVAQFSGRWEVPFDPQNTRPGRFKPGDHFNASGWKNVPKMNIRDTFAVYENAAVRLLELPYEGRAASMVLLVPKRGSVHDLLRTLTAEELREWLGDATPRAVRVSVPLFRTDTASMDLRPALRAMGMERAFGPQADLSLTTGARKLAVTRFVHRVVLHVDEKGTRATAATEVALAARARLRAFDIERPFVFAVVAGPDHVPLFLGIVDDPAGPWVSA